ncbi:hypothetical protein [Sanguibacter suarezii]|uniref:hypothetical protein n=1 Tax=Sanguibacter suarezii TaxID=60921 RepID=UPI00082F3189|nr:hypothetical protein [Sanguibacter suarezii]
MTTTPAPTTSAPVDSTRPVDPDDPREQISVGVLMLNGRLAGRSFADRAEAEAWAQPGEQVVEYNLLCECDR